MKSEGRRVKEEWMAGQKAKGKGQMSKVKRFILHTSYFILLLTSVFWLLTPAFAQTVSYPVANLNNIRYVSAFAGATAGAKIAACLADLPASGGVCDARGLPGAQT